MKGESILFRQLIWMHAGLLPKRLHPPMAKPLTPMHLFSAASELLESSVRQQGRESSQGKCLIAFVDCQSFSCQSCSAITTRL